MSQVEELRRFVVEHRGKSLKRESKEQLVPLLGSLLQVEELVESVAEELSQLSWPDCNDLLVSQWAKTSIAVRNGLIRSLWERRNEPKLVNTARVTLAAALQFTDETSAAALLDLTFNAYGKKIDGLRPIFSRSWLRSSSGQPHAPFTSLRWHKMGPTWRYQLIDLLIAAANEGVALPPDKRQGIRDPRPLLQEWVTRLATDNVDGDKERLHAVADRLKEKGASNSIGAGDSTPQVATAVTSESISPSAPDVPAVQPPPIEKVNAGPSEKAPAVRKDLGSDDDRGFGRKLRGLARQLSGLAVSLNEAIENETLAVEKQLGNAVKERSVLQAEKNRLDSMLASERAEQGELRKKVGTLSDSVERLSDERDSANARTKKVENLAENLEKRLAAAATDHAALLKHLESEREQIVKERDISRREARRIMGEQIAATLEEELAMLRELEKTPASSESETFLRRVVNEIVARLETQGVPVRK